MKNTENMICQDPMSGGSFSMHNVRLKGRVPDFSGGSIRPVFAMLISPRRSSGSAVVPRVCVYEHTLVRHCMITSKVSPALAKYDYMQSM